MIFEKQDMTQIYVLHRDLKQFGDLTRKLMGNRCSFFTILINMNFFSGKFFVEKWFMNKLINADMEILRRKSIHQINGNNSLMKICEV
jgi:hypothetical protein